MQFALGTLVACGAGFTYAWIRGGQLPEVHEVSVKARFKAPGPKLWALISDLEGQPRWKKSLVSVKRIEGSEEVYVEDYGGTKLTLKTEERVEGQRLVRVLVNQNIPYQGSWTYVVEPLGQEECLLTLTEKAQIKNPVFRFLAQGFFGYEESLKAALTELSAVAGPVEFQKNP